MKKVHDSNGNLIGEFNGLFVYSTEDGGKLYRIDGDGDVFGQLSYDDKNLKFMEKGQELVIGTIKDDACCDSSGQIIFTLEM